MGNKLGFIAISGSFVLPLYVHGCRQNHLANLWLKAATLKYLHVPVKSPRISVNVTHEDFLLGIRLHSWNLSRITMHGLLPTAHSGLLTCKVLVALVF